MRNFFPFGPILEEDGAATIEFALIAPVFLMTLFSMIGYGVYLGAAHSVQQVSADAARAAVAGLTQAERQSLAEDYIATSMMNHPFVDADRFEIAVADDTTNPRQFTVTVTYDSSHLPIWSLLSYPLPDPQIRGYATIRIGGL